LISVLLIPSFFLPAQGSKFSGKKFKKFKNYTLQFQKSVEELGGGKCQGTVIRSGLPARKRTKKRTDAAKERR
jgi:hypothetical protein